MLRAAASGRSSWPLWNHGPHLSNTMTYRQAVAGWAGARRPNPAREAGRATAPRRAGEPPPELQKIPKSIGTAASGSACPVARTSRHSLECSAATSAQRRPT
eukprot:8192987-Pyramimonas_sp.AAC.1